MKKLLTLSLMGLASAGAFAQFTINELFVDPASTDDGWEYAEIKGAPGASLNGFSFLSIEGDSSTSTPAQPGFADLVVNLSGLNIGSNGLLLIRFTGAGTTSSISPVESATTLLNVAGSLENGTNSWAIANFVPLASADLDTNNDGVFDLTAGQSIIDAVGWTDTATGDIAYGFNYNRSIINTFTPDAFYQVSGGDAKVFGDVLGPSGLQDFDTSANEMAIYSTFRGTHLDGTVRDDDWENWANSGFGADANVAKILKLTPGGVNPVPEPASMAVLGLGILGLARRRRNK